MRSGLLRRTWVTVMLSLAVGLLGLFGMATANAAQRQIMVYGDSNSWGWKPATTLPTTRYALNRRWPGVMQARLGRRNYNVVVEALSGRTTDRKDPLVPELRGAALDGDAYLPSAIGSHLPLDLVVIMLGTNDTKAHFKRSPARIAAGARKLVRIVKNSGNFFGAGWYPYPAPRVLLIAPPPLGDVSPFGGLFAGGVKKSRRLAAAYRQIARGEAVEFFNAGSVTSTDGVDGVHLTADAHRKLGRAVARRVRNILRSG